MVSFDSAVPAVLVRLDRNPFHHGTLGAVRSLGRAGITVHAVIESLRSPVAGSRYLHSGHPRPDRTPDDAAGPRSAAHEDEKLHGLLLRISERLGAPAVLVPLDDRSAISAARLRPRLAGRYLLPEQPSGLPERVADKAELAAICGTLGLPHPRTVVPGDPGEAARAASALGPPVVAKWSRPWLLPEGSGLRSTVVVRSPREARELFARGTEAGSRLLLQKLLPPGRDLDWFFHGCGGRDGTLLMGAAGRKERSWPVGAGLTAVGRWLPNPAVERLAREVIAALGYRGIADLDFRLDPATGAYHLLDFNPRPGAQFRLFTDASGLDVVRALHLDLTGRPVPPQVPVYGRRFVVENYALLSLMSPLFPAGRRRGGRPRGSGADPRIRAGGTETAWFARDDPRPAYAMTAAWLRRAARGGAVGGPRPSSPQRSQQNRESGELLCRTW
ncbi:ATP-grasp domain-containing protein [Streptomyces sp. NP-1717]|uniref:carboxylate--amine ligase n=1 Tax=Streptomyces sp. NP-1717 TaxID=2704470 RepID=UPI001F5E0BC3|nr:ATP-grasp domain-containing protein [Streptomyces sp. NP-1717]MCI3226101.1 ATP-grasp domain-containing protein [Streptomyces sp. NP-1717]